MVCQSRQISGFAAVLLSVAGLQCCRAESSDAGSSPCATAAPIGPSGENIRSRMIKRFRSHIDDYDSGKIVYENPHMKEPGAQKVMISTEDSYCGGHPEPTYFITFVVADAAPVDVFNVLAATLEQPQWLCITCTLKLVENDLQEQVQGFAATYGAGPLARREFYQWQAYDVNLTSDEFVIGVAGRDNRELHTLQAQEPDAVVGRMCFAFSHITRHPAGTLVRQFTKFDARVAFQIGPFSPRNLYHLVWPILLARLPKIIARSQQQAVKHWDARRIEVPAVFLGRSFQNGSNGSARFGALQNTTRGTTTYAEYSQTQLPWIIVALVVVALCCCCMMCGLLVFCGVCQVPCKKGGGSCWEPISEDEEAQTEEESEWEYEE